MPLGESGQFAASLTLIYWNFDFESWIKSLLSGGRMEKTMAEEISIKPPMLL